MLARKKSTRQRRGFRPAFDILEDRTVPAVITDTATVPYLDATTAILVGMLTPIDKDKVAFAVNEAAPSDPVLADNVNALPAVQDRLLKGDVAMLIGLLKPIGKAVPSDPNRLVHDWFKVGPQPEPPTRPLPGQLGREHAKILIGLLRPAPKDGFNEINPQPQPPRAAPAALDALMAHFGKK